MMTEEEKMQALQYEMDEAEANFIIYIESVPEHDRPYMFVTKDPRDGLLKLYQPIGYGDYEVRCSSELPASYFDSDMKKKIAGLGYNVCC